MKRYLKIFWILFKTNLSKDLAFRFSFFSSLIGTFCFVLLNYLVIYFFIQNVHLTNWSFQQILILLGMFYILSYSFFFFAFRGLNYLAKNIRDGKFDYYLLKPADTQLLVSIQAGSINNFAALIFGILVVIYGLNQLNFMPNISLILLSVITMAFSVIDYYSLALLFIILNFRFGYIEEAFKLVFSFQDFSRYPMEIFLRLPFYLLFISLPFSALSTLPTLILIRPTLPLVEMIVFYFGSFLFIFLIRKIWLHEIKCYTSGS